MIRHDGPNSASPRPGRGGRRGAARRQGGVAGRGLERAHGRPGWPGSPAPATGSPTSPEPRRRPERLRGTEAWRAARHRQVEPGLRPAAGAAAARWRTARPSTWRCRGSPSRSRSSCSTRTTWPTRRAGPRRSRARPGRRAGWRWPSWTGRPRGHRLRRGRRGRARGWGRAAGSPTSSSRWRRRPG